MKPNLLFLLFLFTSSIVFAQKRYENFPLSDTSTYHLSPGLIISPIAPGLLYSVGCYCDSSKMDTIYNATKIAERKVNRDTSKEVEIIHDSIVQDGKFLGVYGHFTGGCFLQGQKTVIAEAEYLDDNLWTITTYKDNQRHVTKISGFYEKGIAEFMIKQGYL